MSPGAVWSVIVVTVVIVSWAVGALIDRAERRRWREEMWHEDGT